MDHKGSLRNRITWAFALFGVGLSGVLAIGWFAALTSAEQIVISETLDAELQYFLQRSENASSKQFASRTTVIDIAPLGDYESIPTYLRTLEPGIHNVTVNERSYRTLVKDINASRYFLRFDDTEIANRQRYSVFLLFASVALATGLSGWAGYWLSGRIIVPIIRLAKDIAALEAGNETGGELHGYPNDELGMLADQFREYRDKLQALLEREEEFAANVSHELRTPVTSINLAVEVLANDPSVSKGARERLERIRRAGREISELVSAFLILAQTETKYSAEGYDCDVNAVVRQVIEDQKIWLGQKPIRIQLDEREELRVKAPSRVVAVLISNLIRNAFRYTAFGYVRVTVDRSRVSIEDSGPGIDANMQQRLFERHVRGDARTGDGAGLGLAIVGRICERYGWQVTLASKLTQGARFDVIFC